MTEPIVIAVRLAGIAIITGAWIVALTHKETRMSKIPLFAFISKLFSKKAAPATTASIAAKAGVSTGAGSIIPVIVHDAGKLASALKSSTTVAALTTKLDSVVSDLESHIEAKTAEVETHAKAEAAALEAKLAASKEVADAKAMIEKITGILKAPAIAEAKASDAADKVSALLVAATQPKPPAITVPGVPAIPVPPAPPSTTAAAAA